MVGVMGGELFDEVTSGGVEYLKVKMAVKRVSGQTLPNVGTSVQNWRTCVKKHLVW